MNKTSLNIQILLYYSSKDLTKLLESINSLIRGDSKLHFILMDQSEDEKEYKEVEKILEKPLKKTNIKITLDRQPNYGFGKGHNEVYRKNKKSYNNHFIILNPDSILHPDLIEKVNKYLRQIDNERWGLLEFEQFPSEHPKFYDPYTLETNWCSGSGLIINREAFEDIGMFDENIFMYGEDVDLSIRMRMAKYKILHLPKASFTHLTKDTDVTKESKFTRLHKQSSELYLRYKFAKDSDVRAYLSLLKEDPDREKIMKMFKVMKKKLVRRTFYKKFVDKNQDYTNFRWTI